MPLSIYSYKQNDHPEDRYDLNLITQALWDQGPLDERQQVYGDWIDLYRYEPDITRADCCILTHHWNHYVEHGKLDEARAEADKAHVNGKLLVIFNHGDYPANVPFENVILFEPSGYRSRPGLSYHSAQPANIDDYLGIYCHGELLLRPKREIPVIGFCGQTNTSLYQTAYQKLRWIKHRWEFRTGSVKWEPPPFETNSFRLKVLRAFEGQPGIHTNYILREKFWAGQVRKRSLKNPARIEYINNILESDYTICMRGAGNYSYRFYETLCLGRIPVFIDTDCLLPFQDVIDYKSIFPRIDIKDLPHAADIVREYHDKMSPEAFIGIQRLCRWLWQEHMTPDGFHRDFVSKIRSMI